MNLNNVRMEQFPDNLLASENLACDRFYDAELAVTRDGIFLIGNADSSVTWRDSSTTSESGTPQQVRM